MSGSTSAVNISSTNAAPTLAVTQFPRQTQPAVSAPTTRTNTKHTPSAAVSLLAGAIAGSVKATVTKPFEFAKTRAQLQASKTGLRNPLAAIAQVARSEGVAAIYTGCSTLMLGTAFKAGVSFLSIYAIRNQLLDERGVLSPARGILAGMLTGAVESVAAVTPTERIETALIDDAKSTCRQFSGGFDATKSIMIAHSLP